MKRGAVVNRPAMSKRRKPNIDSQSSPRVKRKVDFDSQLEHVMSNDGKIHSPIAKKNTASTFSPGASSHSSAVVTPSKHSDKNTPQEEANAYGNRTNSGQVVIHYNPNKIDPLATSPSVLVTQPYGTVGEFKYMTDKDRSNALNSQLTSFQRQICEQECNKLLQTGEISTKEEFPFEFLGVPHTDSQFNVGRICNEAHNGKMNETSILLEGTKIGSNGARISLDMSKVSNCSLFPGQLVGVTGINNSGRKIVVEKVVEGLDSTLVKSCKDDHEIGQNSKVKETGMKIVAVVGPYTSGQDLKYEPLVDLLNFVVQEKPSAVIMMGPFVDIRQEHLKNENEVILEYEQDDGPSMKRHVSYETLFATKISQELEDLYEEFPDLSTKFVLVPSLDDAIAEPT